MNRNENKTVIQQRSKPSKAHGVFGLLLIAGVVFYYFLGGEEQPNEPQIDGNAIVAEILPEEELTKLLDFVDGPATVIPGEYRGYTWQLSTSVARGMMMNMLKKRLEKTPELYLSTEEVFNEWSEAGRKHSYRPSFEGNANINVEILRRYIDSKFSGKDVGAKYQITNQELAHLLVLSKGIKKFFVEYVEAHIERETKGK